MTADAFIGEDAPAATAYRVDIRQGINGHDADQSQHQQRCQPAEYVSVDRQLKDIEAHVPPKHRVDQVERHGIQVQQQLFPLGGRGHGKQKAKDHAQPIKKVARGGKGNRIDIGGDIAQGPSPGEQPVAKQDAQGDHQSHDKDDSPDGQPLGKHVAKSEILEPQEVRIESGDAAEAEEEE